MSVEIETKLDIAAVEALSKKKSEPAWMLEKRTAAFQRYSDQALPKWDRTDLVGLNLDRFEPYQAVPAGLEVQAFPDALRQIAESKEDANLVLQYESEVVFERLQESLQEKGVILTSMERAVKCHPQLVKKHFGTVVDATEDKFRALHEAFWSGGAFVYVPKDVEVEVPLHLHTFTESNGLGIFPHTLIIADVGARVSVVEVNEGAGTEKLAIGTVEIVVKDGAKVQYAGIQNLSQKDWNFTVRRASVGRDGGMEWILAEFGSRLSRTANESLLREPGGEANALAVFFGDSNQHLDVGVKMTHIGSHTYSDMVTKGVLKDTARGVYRGMTDIKHGAKDTNAYQKENTLILNENARSDAIPGLEIDETEVAAGHAATVGQIDVTQLFYLMSRGLSKDLAIRTLVLGFFESVLKNVPLEAVKEDMNELIHRKMNR